MNRTSVAEDLDELIPISLVAHTVFCPRRAWLESTGERVVSVAMEEGQDNHRRVDARSDDRLNRRRSVTVQHSDFGVVGRCDVVALTGSDQVEVVEFKSAPLRRTATVTEPQVIQLALQGMCLEHMGFTVTGHSVYFTTSRKTIPVEVGGSTVQEASEWVQRTRDVVSSAAAPPALRSDARCGGCSHAGVCLPDERTWQPVPRRVQVADPEGEVLHVAQPGSRVSLSRGRVTVTCDGERVGDVPLEKVSGLVVHGNVDVSSALMRELLWRGTTTVWCSFNGRVTGYARSALSPNGQARLQQAILAGSGDLDLAREFITAKIANQATQLRRNGGQDAAKPVKRIRWALQQAESAESVEVLLGAEGDAASQYFRAWPLLFSKNADLQCVEHWPGRRGRSASDPINVALNYVYALLLGDVTRAIVAVGLDPHAGFVHSANRNKPALALDLMEQFRPVVADSVVLAALNTRALTSRDFTIVFGDWRIRDDARKKLISTYKRRVGQSIKHPIFEYEVTWQRAMEVQARLLLGYLDRTQPAYRGVRTR